jgi:hypothetical protein
MSGMRINMNIPLRNDVSVKTKNILTIFATLVATFIYPEVTIWLVPLAISVITLSKFGKNEIAKYIGLFSLKPVFIRLLLILIADFGFLEKFYFLYSYEIAHAIFWIVPELILTLVIVYVFRNLFHNDRVVWLFLIGDTIRWLSLFIESLIPDPIPEPYFYTQFYVVIFFYLVFPSLYAIFGFISVRERVFSENVAH